MLEEENEKRILNMGLSMSYISELSTVYIPLSSRHFNTQYSNFPYLKMSEQNKFQTSAIFGSAISEIVNTWRPDISNSNMREVSNVLATDPSKNICALETSLPFPVNDSKRKISSLLDPKENPIQAADWMSSLTPNLTREKHEMPLGSVCTISGVPNNCFEIGANWKSQSELLKYYLHGIPNESFAFPTPMGLPICFPRFFTPTVDQTGIVQSYITDVPRVESVPIMTHVQNTMQLHSHVDLLSKSFNSIDIRYHHQFGIDSDLPQIQNNLQQLAARYSHNQKRG